MIFTKLLQNHNKVHPLQTPGANQPTRTRRTPELSDSTDRTRDAMNPGKCCWGLRNKSANTHTLTFCDSIYDPLIHITNMCVKVLTSQVMEEVLPWLHGQLQSKVKGKKTERIRQWLAVSSKIILKSSLQ